MTQGFGASSRTDKSIACKSQVLHQPGLHTWRDMPLGSQVQFDLELKAKLSLYEAHALAVLETKHLREKLAALEASTSL